MKLATFIVAAVLLVGAAVLGMLVLTGSVQLPWRHAEPKGRPIPPGSTMVPMSVRPMRAYSTVTRDDLLSPDTLKLRLWPEPPTAMTSDDPPIAHSGDILNRVLRYDKGTDYVFHESDFFPVGTTPGEAAGVPPGKVAITFDLTQVTGARDLKAGDHVDLGGTQSIDLSKTRLGQSGVNGYPLEADKVAPYRQLAHDAVVVSGVTVKQVPYMTSPGLNSAAQVRTKPVEYVVIAVDPSEVPAVQQAVGVGAEIACMLHSGQPTTRPADGTADASDQPRYTTVDKVVGDKHTLVVLPKPGFNPASGNAFGGQP